ncbi:hypothetical protein Rs2_32608 [Raphanus sativus]|uniref:Uncharacterized protein LOC108814521 n=1 Tax=Raphanus sativus TaxID=3726 RepID=A0A6J0K4P1_RAPSA|nr:uncharacterized protein LOC108814521 [Raphanus sativus]XP_018442613.1 uncharacterized protein LOC108814521 [Raphanus sativus]XP_018442614.1 uncharacterized protein LOC108814521 [Raphanus sativus]XP_056847165.1 uncharacterized protein LOC108814521 [Raphanus sativus]KAJ4882515.1 hypothetical protein Rs2_32608 [Raphanus sativus]
MDITVNELTRREKAGQNHHIRSDSAASTPKNQQEKAQAFLSCSAVKVGEKRQRDEYAAEICNTDEQNNRRGSNDNGCAERGEESVQCAAPKFKDFDKLRADANFAVGQSWALYDAADGMPRVYAQIRKVSAPSFGLRITYLEPDPKDEKEIKWFEEDLPVSAGKFRLGKNENIKDISKFSHLIKCNEGSSTGHFTVSPRKGETWALFKNWDINWSSEPDSHRSYEYEFVEILSDYADKTGVFVSYLHKAKGFASVFFRTGTGPADIFRINSLYRFSHMVPSFKLTGTEAKGLPKDAYELDQAALPKTIQEVMVPSESDSKPKRRDIYFASKGKVFQTGQIWSFCSGYDDLPLYYGKIQKISFTQAFKKEPLFKLHVSRLKATTPFPEGVIEWIDRGMPVGCGTFYARKALEIISPSQVSHQVIPQVSLDGNEYTILPKIGEVWAIYRYWSCHIDVEDLEFGLYDIVEVLDDSLDDYKVQLLVQESYLDDNENYDRYFKGATEYVDNEVEGSEPIFTIPKSERNRFSNKVHALRVTKEIQGELMDLFSMEFNAVPINILHS